MTKAKITKRKRKSIIPVVVILLIMFIFIGVVYAVNLTWEANKDPNVTGYAIYMSKSPGSRYIPVAKRIRENYY